LIHFYKRKYIIMLSVLKSQVTNLDSSRFKVMLVWDPDNARDVGWLTVEKDMKVDVEALQIRDVNLDKISHCSMLEPETPKQSRETEGYIADSSEHPNIYVKEDNQEVITIEDDAIEVYAREAKCTKTYVLDEVGLSNKSKVQCSKCKLVLLRGNLPRHLALKHEKVRCAICGVYLKKMNLEFHTKVKHSTMPTCVACGKTFKSERGLNSHRRWCINSGSKCTKNDGSSAQNDIPGRKEVVEGVIKTFLDNDMTKPVRNERVDFSIIHEGRCYSCSRFKGVQIKGSLKKFCKHVGKDLKFEFEGRFLTGAEFVDTFADCKISAIPADHV